MDFAVAAKRKRKERQLLRPCQRTKKAIENEGDPGPIVVDTLGTVSKSLEKGLERGGNQTIQTTALLRLAKILRRVLEI